MKRRLLPSQLHGLQSMLMVDLVTPSAKAAIDNEDWSFGRGVLAGRAWGMVFVMLDITTKKCVTMKTDPNDQKEFKMLGKYPTLGKLRTIVAFAAVGENDPREFKWFAIHA